MLREFKSRPGGIGMLDAPAQVVGARADQPGRPRCKELDGAGRKAQRAHRRRVASGFVARHSARDSALAHTSLIAGGVCRAELQSLSCSLLRLTVCRARASRCQIRFARKSLSFMQLQRIAGP